MNYARIGTVIHGTMRTEDLLDAFASALEDCVQRNADTWCSDEGRMQRDAYMAMIGTAREIDPDGEDADEFLNEDLFSALNQFAAPYCYFGAHQGDGCDYGFWPSIDHLDEAARDGEVLRVGSTDEVPADYVGHVMQVSDHGNVTLYEPRSQGALPSTLVEIWSCV